MIINTADCCYDVASSEDVSGLYSLSSRLESHIRYIDDSVMADSSKIDILFNEINAIKEKLDHLLEMYGVVQLRCDDNPILHVDLASRDGLSEFLGG